MTDTFNLLVVEDDDGHATLLRRHLPAELDRCYALGAAACLVKPVDYGAFGELIQRLGGVLMSAWLPNEVPFPPHAN